MTVNELIEELKSLADAGHGDTPIHCPTYSGEVVEVSEVSSYWEKEGTYLID